MLIKTNYIIEKKKIKNKKTCIACLTKPKLAMYTSQSLHGHLFGTHSFISNVYFTKSTWASIWYP